MKRITANIPERLLNEAREVRGEGITETLTYGLELILRSEAARLAEQLRGKIKIHEDEGRSHGTRRG